MSINEFIYPWNKFDFAGNSTHKLFDRKVAHVDLNDETLRDGLQSPSVKTPCIEDKIKILHYMNDLGITVANIGLPMAGERVKSDVFRLAEEAARCRMSLKLVSGGRTLKEDFVPIVELSQKVGLPLEGHAFIGSSMIRRFTEDWNFEQMLEKTEACIRFGTENGLEMMFVTEDTTRAHPRFLKELFRVAINAGARRLCLCDTVGYATPDGVINLIEFTRKTIWDSGVDVKIDWHGHNDRGLGVTNALVAAVDGGVDRIHGTCLGIGERSGNASMDQILINLFLLDMYQGEKLKLLNEYCHFVSRTYEMPIPRNYPAIGADAFRTATGVHAAAIIKAQKKDQSHWLADYVYSSVPAEKLGGEQIIEIGPASGKSNVIYWLKKRGYEPDSDRVNRVFEFAKQADHILTESEILNLI
ncbi:MAG: 2-isopropylmalate synthase [Deltaproteobacteria bacterium]|nr:2-isopropylmalate synthase [Deltaproteobacteria bacterium]